MPDGLQILVVGRAVGASWTAEVRARAEVLARSAGGSVAVADCAGDRTEPESLAARCREENVSLVLLPHTLWGSDFAARLAGELGCPAATACTALDVSPEGLCLTRPVHGGALQATFLARDLPIVASVELADPPRAERGEALVTAARVVAGGRGVGGPEGFAKLQELASRLGAALASSRPPCDAGWVPSSLQVGITGATVRPDLYVAVGISGSVQHLAGMHRAKCIVAVNRDREAPIFRYAHLGAVGDWSEIVTGMLDVLEAPVPREVDGR